MLFSFLLNSYQLSIVWKLHWPGLIKVTFPSKMAMYRTISLIKLSKLTLTHERQNISLVWLDRLRWIKQTTVQIFLNIVGEPRNIITRLTCSTTTHIWLLGSGPWLNQKYFGWSEERKKCSTDCKQSMFLQKYTQYFCRWLIILTLYCSATVHFFAKQYNRKGLYSNQIIIGFGLT